MRSKFNMFGHVIRMNNSRKIRSVMMGVIDGNQKEGDLAENGWMTAGIDATRRFKR